jgi:hypothetical protein
MAVTAKSVWIFRTPLVFQGIEQGEESHLRRNRGDLGAHPSGFSADFGFKS